MLIDTGASETTIDSSLAKQVGLPAAPMSAQVIAAADHLMPKVRVDEVQLEIPHLFSIRMPMLRRSEPPSAASRRRIVGAIGQDLISNMVLSVNKTLVF